MRTRPAARAVARMEWLPAARAVARMEWLPAVRAVARFKWRPTVLAFVLLLAGCTDRSAPAPAAPPSPAPVAAPPSPAQVAAPKAPALPANAAANAAAPGSAAPQPLDLADAAVHLPKLDGDAMLPLKTTSDGLQAHATWCLAGTGADTVAESLSKTMEAAGYTNLVTRGDPNKAGVTGERDAWRLSYVVSASTAANCRAPGHYFASATLFRAR